MDRRLEKIKMKVSRKRYAGKMAQQRKAIRKSVY